MATASTIGAVLIGAGALPAAAESTIVVGDWVDMANVDYLVDGNIDPTDAGTQAVTIDGDEMTVAYCIDFSGNIDAGDELTEVDWEASGIDVADLEIVEKILANYHPAGNGPAGYELVGSDDDKAAGTQAAIWHFTDDMTPAAGNVGDAMTNYETILAAVAADVLEGFGEPVTLSIEPPADTEAPTGELVGPYVVHTTASEAMLTTSDGVTLHNEDGTPFAGPAVDGSQVWLKSDAAGEGTVSATAEGAVGAGRVFVNEGTQSLMLATTVDTAGDDSAAATWVTSTSTSTSSSSTSSSSTTTAPETSTSIDLSSSTTVLSDVTTTLNLTPQANTLPKTGSNATTPLLVGGLALVLFGGGLTLGVRRMRGTR